MFCCDTFENKAKEVHNVDLNNDDDNNDDNDNDDDDVYSYNL